MYSNLRFEINNIKFFSCVNEKCKGITKLLHYFVVSFSLHIVITYLNIYLFLDVTKKAETTMRWLSVISILYWHISFSLAVGLNPPRFCFESIATTAFRISIYLCHRINTWIVLWREHVHFLNFSGDKTDYVPDFSDCE